MIYSATFSELLGNVRSENVLFLHFYTGSSTALQTCLFSKVLLCFHFLYSFSPTPPVFFFFFCASVPDEGAVGWRHVISAAALWLAADSHPTQLWLFSAEEALAPGMSSVLRNGAAAACVCVCVCFLSLSLSLYVCVGALTMVWTKQRADYCPCCEQEQGRFFIVVIEGAEWRGVEVSLWTRHWRRLENKVRWITVFFFSTLVLQLHRSVILQQCLFSWLWAKSPPVFLPLIQP